MRTNIKTIATGIAGAALLGMLAACGSGLSSASTGGSGNVVSPKSVLMGSGTGTAFQKGTLDIGTTKLSAGGSTSIAVNVENGDGTAYTGAIQITFISPCFQAGLAQFFVAGSSTPTNVISTSTGQAVITYSATGCSVSDTITATAPDPNGGATLTASGTLTVAAATLGSIQWVSTSNDSQIALSGSGGVETATVVFKVTDTTGGPVPNKTVKFSLETTAGGITFTPASAVSGTDGQVQTIVHAGTEHGTVRVKASTVASGATIETVSPGIVVSTGIPTQDRFSLALTVHNVEGYDVDGATSTLTVRMADRFANPVAVGTTVSFTANGGHIEPGCTTTDSTTGACEVTWTSANPRPQGPTSAPASVTGHAEVLAYTTGEEHFTDVNGNGVFDSTDQFTSLGGSDEDVFSWARTPTVDNIGEIYLDENEDGQFNSGEFFFDFNKDHTRNIPNGKYHGAGCTGTSSVSCDSSTTLSIGLQDCIIMSTTGVTIVPDDGSYVQTPGTTKLYDVYDGNGNAPPAGMTISVVTNGTSATVLQSAIPDITCNLSPPGFVADANDITNPTPQQIGGGSYQIAILVPGTAQTGNFTITAKAPETGTLSSSLSIDVP